MKIILSRKGFDSGYGGQPSPILPDGTMLSLPIPARSDELKFTDLTYNGRSYYDIITGLKPGTKIKESYKCHIDPDLRYDAIKRKTNWKPLFGQAGGSQGHLVKQGVGIGDLFLFFGWFKETEIINDRIHYIKNAPDIHAIFGYLEIGKTYTTANQLPAYAGYHPHADKFETEKNNCIYEASDKLSIDNSLPGSGCFKFNGKLVLTKQGESRSRWSLPECFKDVNISYHTADSFKHEYFDSAKKGQEFVVECNGKIIEWAKDILQIV
jgi:hypothetical protein